MLPELVQVMVTDMVEMTVMAMDITGEQLAAC